MLLLLTVSTLWPTRITFQLISNAAIAVNVRVLVFGGSWRVILRDTNAAPFDACTAIWFGLITDSMPLKTLLTFDRWILRYFLGYSFGLLRGFACPVLTAQVSIAGLRSLVFQDSSCLRISLSGGFLVSTKTLVFHPQMLPP